MSNLAISNSELSKWARCPRAWMVEYYLGFRLADAPVTGNMPLGIRVHVALQAHFGHGLDAIAVLGILYQIEIAEHPEAEHDLRAEMDLALIMVTGYLEWAEETGDEADYKLIAAEAEVRTDIPGLPGVMLRAKLDQAVQRISDGARLFRDWKTSANFDRHEMLALDPQMKTYCLIQQLMVRGGQDPPIVAGGRITTLRRVKRSSASKPPYYRSDDFGFNPDTIDATLRRVRRLCQEIQIAREHLDQIYAAGGVLEVVNRFQREVLRPVPIPHDCSWSCPLASGTCAAMDDGSDWSGMLANSGRWEQGDPYQRYLDDPIRSIRARLEST